VELRGSTLMGESIFKSRTSRMSALAR
jgi:hypothetical protein